MGQEDHSNDPSPNKKKTKSTMARRIGNILATKKERTGSAMTVASMAVLSDSATQYSADGDKSVAVTVHSQATVKASNRKLTTPKGKSPGSGSKGSGGKGWKTLKRLVGVSLEGESRSEIGSEELKRERGSRSPGRLNSIRKRLLSDDSAKQQQQQSKASETSSMSARTTSHLDLAIRGRLDGVDILSLGPAATSTLNLPAGKKEASSTVVFASRSSSEGARSGANSNDSPVELQFDPLTVSFTGANTFRKPSDLVMDMIWASAGKDQPELMLEGYMPGGDDRWSVRLGFDEAHSPEKKTVAFRHTRLPRAVLEEDDSTAELTDDGSTNMPSHKLWDSIWGEEPPPPVPAHMQSASISSDDEEDVMQRAAACSVPIDLDEDTFIISSPAHFRSVHDLTMVPIQRGRFDSAISIFDKLLKGLEDEGDPKLEHLQACTYHNKGIILMCQEKFDDALQCFQNAVKIRDRCLPANHPDIGVSLMREGEAFFALRKYDDALKSFRLALAISPTEDATRAKMLNNSGVVYYQQQNFQEALKAFTSALEIQRQWLDGPIRRESMVYDASITLGNMGKVFLQMKEYEIAYSVFEEGCLVRFSFPVYSVINPMWFLI